MKDSYYDYAVIGGDMRQVYLTEALANHTNRICHYALCKMPDKCRCLQDSTIISGGSLEETCSLSHCIVCPIPFSRDGKYLNQSALQEDAALTQLLSALKPGQSFFAGCIAEEWKETAMEKGVHVHDLMQEQTLSYFNSIATAEGAMCEAIRKSPQNLHQSRCAVLGFGRCGSTLTHKLKGMSANVYVASESLEERAKAAIVADQVGTLKEFESGAFEFDFIFNTIPALVVTEKVLANLKCSVTIIDIASNPGGVDYKAAEKLEIDAALCPGLPGKYAPMSSAKAVKEAIERILKE